MEKSNSYAYFAFKGDDFDPDVITKGLGIEPSRLHRKGNKGEYGAVLKFSGWYLRSSSNELLDINKLVTEVVNQLKNKTEMISRLKETHELNTVLEIVLFIDVNEDCSTPMLGHDMDTIDFLSQTQTITDVDIYRFNRQDED